MFFHIFADETWSYFYNIKLNESSHFDKMFRVALSLWTKRIRGRSNSVFG